MKKCTSCAKDLPDAALHCVFCGAKQPPVPASPQAKTVMGWDANELLKNMQQGQASGQAPPPAGPPPPQNPMTTMPAPAGQNPMATLPAPAASAAKTVFAAQAPMMPMGGPPPPAAPVPGMGGAATMMAPGQMGGPPMGGPPMGGPPMGGPMASSPLGPSSASAQTVMAPVPAGLPPIGGQPPMGQMGSPMGQMGSPMGGPGYAGGPSPGQIGGPPPPMGGPSMGGPGPGYMGAPPMGPGPGYGGPMGQMGQMGAPMSPPYLASQTAARMGAPFEPYKDGLRVALVALGAVLLVATVVPFTGDPVSFRWDALTSDGVDALAKFKLIYVAAAAILALVFGLVPLATVPRGALAAVLGLTPVVLGLVSTLKDAPEFHWQVLVGFVATVTLVPGLFLRHEYRSQMLPRILTTIGALCVIVLYVVPDGGDPPIKGLIDGISGAGGKMKVVAIMSLLPFVIAALSLLCWIPAPSTAGAKVMGWLAILSGVIIAYTGLLVAGHLADAVKAAPNASLLAPWAGMPGEAAAMAAAAAAKAAAVAGAAGKAPVAISGPIFEPLAAVWSAFIGYGVATILGKNLEHA